VEVSASPSEGPGDVDRIGGRRATGLREGLQGLAMRTRTCAVMVVPLVLALAGCGGSDADPDPDPDEAADGADEVDPAADDGATDDGAADAGDGDEQDPDAVDIDEQGTAHDGEGDCPDGPRELGGVSVVTFLCGSATATVTTSDGDWSLVGGTCETREDTFAVNFGTVVLDVAAALDGTAPEVDYVGVAVHEGAGGDGSYDDVDMVTVVATIAGEEFGAGTGTVSLRDGRTAGEAATEGVTIAFECG
jgi:hypothetical protein